VPVSLSCVPMNFGFARCWLYIVRLTGGRHQFGRSLVGRKLSPGKTRRKQGRASKQEGGKPAEEGRRGTLLYEFTSSCVIGPRCCSWGSYQFRLCTNPLPLLLSVRVGVGFDARSRPPLSSSAPATTLRGGGFHGPIMDPWEGDRPWWRLWATRSSRGSGEASPEGSNKLAECDNSIGSKQIAWGALISGHCRRPLVIGSFLGWWWVVVDLWGRAWRPREHQT